MISRCNNASTNKIVVVSENKRTFRIKNNSLFLINAVTVDPCYISEGLRCDYLFEIINIEPDEVINKVLYVELKGSDVEHAVDQLEATINFCRSIHQGVP
jgi:hypothetical protein